MTSDEQDQEVDALQNRIKDLESMVYSLIGTNQIFFQKDVKLYDGNNIQTGYQSGTIIGTTNKQKLGFFGKAPIVQPATPVTLADVVALLRNLGLSQ